MRNDVAKQGLHTEFMGHTLGELAKDVLTIARAGLNARGQNESTFLNILDDEVARDKTKAQELLELYNNVWGKDVTPVFQAAAY